MSRLTTLSQRNPTHNSSPSPVLYPPSGPGSGLGLGGSAGPSSGRGSPFPRPGSSASQHSQYNESPYGGGMSGYTRATHDVETQNDERLEGLLGKVKSLKDITVGIGNEVRDSNIQLGSMNDAFSSTSNLLGGTFRRMNKMASKQGGNWCWFMGFLLLVMWIFVIVWWLRR